MLLFGTVTRITDAMKLQHILPLAAVLLFSACMEATITQEIEDPSAPEAPQLPTQPKLEDIGPVYEVVTDEPTLIGGRYSLLDQIQYPTIAKKALVEGRVFVQFVVDPEGNVRNAAVTKGIGAGCDEEALRVIRLAKFNPGRLDGEAVNTKLSMSFMFKIR